MGHGEKGTIVVEGQEIQISNPNKLIWPEAGLTKLDYLQSLIILAPYLLRYCRNRYLTTIRFPNGIHDKSFYQKNCPVPKPDFVATGMLEGIEYVLLNDLPTLLWLGNLACLEFHPSFHYVGERVPAEWLIDLDPTREVEPRIMEAAEYIGEILDSLHIASIPKTSGATGVQIYIPIVSKPDKRYTFAQLRSLGQFIATFAVQKYPKLFTIERLKKDRGDLIYIDYLQHWYGKTLSAPYTPRARAAASLSTPLLWSEVAARCDPRDFTLRNISARLQEKGDLIEQVPPQDLDFILSKLGHA